MNIIETNLQFGDLSQRPLTDMLVIHHTGERDIDASAAQIHDWHLANGWAGIGYHFVIRKNGDVEIGRPEWAVGSHAAGENSHTIGIHLSGDFSAAYPTEAQLNACAELVKDLCHDYGIPVDRNFIVGHCDLMATDCPGKNLYGRLDEIINRAKGFDANVVGRRVETIYDLAERYESGGDVAAVGEGYGLFQFTGATVDNFVDWLKGYPDAALANYGTYLRQAKDFDSAWRELATVDPGHFGDLQREFVEGFFYNPAILKFAKENFTVVKHSIALQAVVFARAVQHGIRGCLEVFNNACAYPNLSYVDAADFDRELIADVYDYLAVTRPDLRSRWVRERADALA